MQKKHSSVQAVLFDFDGTLTKPDAIDFTAIKEAVGCPPSEPVLEYIEGIADSTERKKALTFLEQSENEAAGRSEPNDGAEKLIADLHKQGLAVGIVTRNSRESVNRALENFTHVDQADFDVIVSRDDPVQPKPGPGGILYAAEKLKIEPGRILVVGDYVFDMQAGNAAGSRTVFLNNRQGPDNKIPECDYSISGLDELTIIVRQFLPLPAGKLPNDLLNIYLDMLEIEDDSVLVKAGVGEDTAAVSIADEEVITLKTDPITFVVENIGTYAVQINANDIATSGATPRWFLTTLLLPVGTTPAEILDLMLELKGVYSTWGISLCGGHTEITDAVTRPVVNGTLIGTVARKNLIDKRNMRPGDRVLVTKGAAVEGTAILAGECAALLRDLGVSDEELRAGRDYLKGISILPEAAIARRCRGVTAMHDVTEGGLATALEELSIAGGHKIRIDMSSIRILPETERLCGLLGLNPLGLIGSGSLLVCCTSETHEQLLADMHASGIETACIGEVLETGQGVEAHSGGKPVAWPRFAVDELARFFQEKEV